VRVVWPAVVVKNDRSDDLMNFLALVLRQKLIKKRKSGQNLGIVSD